MLNKTQSSVNALQLLLDLVNPGQMVSHVDDVFEDLTAYLAL